jgi:hypothetical protein
VIAGGSKSRVVIPPYLWSMLRVWGPGEQLSLMWWKVLCALAAALATPFGVRALGSYLAGRYARRYPTHKSFRRGAVVLKTDTVVFVHGLHGHFDRTWPKTPELLQGDPDLPHVDVLLWGYRASIFPGVLRLPDIGRALMSFVRDETNEHSHLFFVGHSLGGLVILDGLTQEARDGRARGRPAGVTRHVVLYATPVNGTAVASAILSTVGRLPRIGHLLISGHLQELQSGTYCDDLIVEVEDRLYDPTIAPGDVNSKVSIPIKAIAGELDQVVRTTSATFFRRHPPPSFFPTDDHFTVKQPVDRDDPRYKALKQPLAGYYAAWLRVESVKALAGDVAARILLLQRCHNAAVTRLRAHPCANRAADAPERIEELVYVAMTLAVGSTLMDFGTTFDTALEVMVRAGK